MELGGNEIESNTDIMSLIVEIMNFLIMYTPYRGDSN